MKAKFDPVLCELVRQNLLDFLSGTEPIQGECEVDSNFKFFIF